MKAVNRVWEDAASIFETAAAAAGGDPSEIAILVDDRQSLRIVDARGWGLDALRREYQAGAAYVVKRTSTSVVVEGSSGSDHCTFSKALPTKMLTNLGGLIPHHLIHSEQRLLGS